MGHAKPCQRGRKRARASTGVADGSAKCEEECGEEHETVWPDVEQGLEHASKTIPKMQELGGVRGRYLPQAMLLPQEHAVALFIGRIIIWGAVNAVPQRTLEGLMAHLPLTSKY